MKSEDRNIVVPHDTEDRGWWHIHGERKEILFVSMCRDRLKIDACINPDKERDKTAPDLIVEGKMAELKTQNTPFFTAKRYRMDPRFTITFNRKDYERYLNVHPNIIIYVWVEWQQTAWRDNQVEYLEGVYRLPFAGVARIIAQGASEHIYSHRKSPEDRNAKSSFLLDIREFECLVSTERRK